MSDTSETSSDHESTQRSDVALQKLQLFISVLAAISRSENSALAEQQRDVEEQLKPGERDQDRAESDQGSRGGLLHLRDPLGAVLRVEPGAGNLSRLREADRQEDLRHRDLAWVLQLDGESRLLHDLQQHFPTGFQKRPALPVSQARLATRQVGAAQAA